jgi:hypothetical protein
MNNPVFDIFTLFNNVESIHILNEWEVIDPDKMEVSYLRLREVFEELNLSVPTREEIILKHYTLAD